MTRPLRFLAGPDAMARIRRDGFHDDLFDVVAGASGGAKWLSLTRLDQAIFGSWFRDRTRPLHMVGSSIGAWRFACVARRDPVAACRRFEDHYLNYEVEAPVTPAVLTQHCRVMLDVILGETGAEEVLSHPAMRLEIIAVRGRGPAGRNHPLSLGIGLAAAAVANAASRRTLALFFERTLIHDARSRPAFDCAGGFPTQPVPLSKANLIPALLATAAVPFLFEAVPQLEGARPGLYLDGGIMDYHLDLPFEPPGLVLYPHFSDRVVPGWFDKALRWRRPSPRNMARTVLLCPSAAFLASLPYGKIPDRGDFKRMPTAERQRYWKTAVAETQRLADVWAEAVATDRVPDLLEPMPV